MSLCMVWLKTTADVFFRFSVLGFIVSVPFPALAEDCPPEMSTLEFIQASLIENLGTVAVAAKSEEPPKVSLVWHDRLSDRTEVFSLSHPALLENLRSSEIPQLTGDEVYVQPGGGTLALFEQQIQGVEDSRAVWRRFYNGPGPYREFRNLYFGASRRAEDLLSHVSGLPYETISNPMHVTRTGISSIRGGGERPQALVVTSDFCAQDGDYNFPASDALEDSGHCNGRRFRLMSVLSISFRDNRGRFAVSESSSTLIINELDGSERVFRGTIAEIRAIYDRQP